MSGIESIYFSLECIVGFYQQNSDAVKIPIAEITKLFFMIIMWYRHIRRSK